MGREIPRLEPSSDPFVSRLYRPFQMEGKKHTTSVLFEKKSREVTRSHGKHEPTSDHNSEFVPPAGFSKLPRWLPAFPRFTLPFNPVSSPPATPSGPSTWTSCPSGSSQPTTAGSTASSWSGLNGSPSPSWAGGPLLPMSTTTADVVDPTHEASPSCLRLLVLLVQKGDSQTFCKRRHCGLP